MIGASIVDLAVLGIASDGPIKPDSIAVAAKALVPEHWHPTTSVIAAVIERNLGTAHLRRTGVHRSDERLNVTLKGIAKTKKLLLCPPEDLAPSAFHAAEAIQMCLLDSTDANTAHSVLTSFRNRLQARLKSFEQRSAKCPYEGRYKTFWMIMEQQRLEAMVHFLSGVADEAGMSKDVDQVQTDIAQ